MKEELAKAGDICRKVKEGVAKRVKPGAGLLELAEWLEGEIRERGGEPAFPVNICVDEVAAHFTPPPGFGGKFEEGQIVKVDFGVHVEGWPVDNALTVDLGEHGELEQASADGLAAAKELLVDRGPEATIAELGRAIKSAIADRGFEPIYNLTGHSMDNWLLHSGQSIFNYEKKGTEKAIGEGLFAIEPFATPGEGRVGDGPRSEIYRLLEARPQRLPQARELLKEVKGFRTLPFCSRWVSRPAFLGKLVRGGVLHNYPLLVEVSGAPVSQAENSFLVKKEKVEVLA